MAENNNYLNLLIECCKNLNSSDRCELIKALKPSRFEWATLTPFDKLDGVEIYIKGIYDSIIVNDILDKKYPLAKEKIKSTLTKAVKKYYSPSSVKERIFMFMLKHSFLALRVFSAVYYGNFEVLRRSKILRIISKGK